MAKSVKLDANGYRKFGVRDNLAYAAGDLGCNMSFALKNTVQIFWTQYMGVSLAAMGVLMLIVQVWDAINDPVIGAMVDADKHTYKRNKFLQYIWVGSIGLLVAGAAMFLPFPQAPMVLKYVLFVIGYILWDAFYTIANVPYGSLLSLITNDAGDRAMLSTFRSIGSMVGNMLPMAILPFLIYDSNNELKGNTVFWAALIMGGIGFICFQFMIKNTVIRVEQDVKCNEEEMPKFNVFKAFGSFMQNRAAVGATLAPVGMFIGMYGSSYATTAMFQSYFHNSQISGVMQIISMLPMFAFMPFIRKIVAKFGKKEAVTVGTLIALVGYLMLVILPISPDNKGVAMWVAGQLVAGIGGGIYQCVSWSLMADAMDYGEWKFGVREEGTTYALHSFFRKLAQGVGPSLGLFVAAALGFVEANGGNQTFEVALKMRYQAAWFYVLSGVIQFVGLALVYNLDKKTLAKVQEDLAARKAQ
ncbi:MAG: MFS transporter [Oscillospiraceae bacterium]|nr:MFS transporter [Oscillospiraceae bacterium]